MGKCSNCVRNVCARDPLERDILGCFVIICFGADAVVLGENSGAPAGSSLKGFPPQYSTWLGDYRVPVPVGGPHLVPVGVQGDIPAASGFEVVVLRAE